MSVRSGRSGGIVQSTTVGDEMGGGGSAPKIRCEELWQSVTAELLKLI